MKVFDKLNRKNFKLYASANYDNPECIDITEFKEDINRFKYVKRLLSRYEAHNDLQERLILNHLIVIYNVFGIEAGLNILELKLLEKHWYLINPFLVFLKAVEGDIEMDLTVADALRKI